MRFRFLCTCLAPDRARCGRVRGERARGRAPLVGGLHLGRRRGDPRPRAPRRRTASAGRQTARPPCAVDRRKAWRQLSARSLLSRRVVSGPGGSPRWSTAACAFFERFATAADAPRADSATIWRRRHGPGRAAFCACWISLSGRIACHAQPTRERKAPGDDERSTQRHPTKYTSSFLAVER